MTQQALLNRLSWLHANYGPAQTKTAEAYFYNLTNDPADVLSEKFVKLAELQGMDPWGMAFDVAQSYSEIEKTASFGWPMSQYYLEWAEDIEKDAFVRNLAAGLYRGAQRAVGAVGAAVGKRSAGTLGQLGDTAAVRAAGNVEKSMASQTARGAETAAKQQAKFDAQIARNAEKQTLQAQNQAMKSMDPAQRVAYREQRMAQQAAKAPKPAPAPAAAPAAAPAPAAAAPAPAAPAAGAAPATAAGTPAAGAGAGVPPPTGAPTAAAATKPTWGQVAVGTGAVAGVGALGYGGYRLARGPSQGGSYQQQ